MFNRLLKKAHLRLRSYEFLVSSFELNAKLETRDSKLFLGSHIAVLSLLCGLLFFPRLGSIPFFDKGEPREALVVQAIVRSGEWLFPLRNEAEIPSKPPLFHWFGALTSLLLGRISEATVRFPSAFFATLGVLVIYMLGRRIYDSRTALLGGLILATSLAYQSQAVVARVDMTLTFFMTLSLALFYLLFQGSLAGPFWYYSFYLLLGIGVLAKGPVSLVIPGMVICLFLGLRKRWDFLARLCSHKGVILTLLIGFSWYGMALIRGGEDFFGRQVMHENIARFFVYGEGGTGHQKPVYHYFPYLFLLGLPWTLFLPFVVIDWFRAKSFAEEGSLFLILWVLVTFVLFSLSAGKRAIYLLPLYPSLALLTARWFAANTETGKLGAVGLRLIGGVCLVASVVVGTVLIGVIRGEGLGSADSIASVLRPKDQAGFYLVRNVLEQGGWLFVSVMAVVVFLWLLAGWHLFRLSISAVPMKLFFLSVLTWLLAQWSFIPAMAEARSYRSFMGEVSRRMVPGSQLHLYPGAFDKSSLVFYHGGPISVLEENPAALTKRLRSSDDCVIISEEDWRRIQTMDRSLPSPQLKSTGSGPDGDAPLVVIHGVKSGEPHS